MLVVLVTGVAVILTAHNRRDAQKSSSTAMHADALPATVTSQVHFKLYYFNSPIPGNFHLAQNKVDYKNGVLIFELKNPSGKTLAFTEEATPKDYDVTQLKADKDYSTAVGKAYITNGETRTTAALFTKDGTWILVNAPDPIGSDAMQQIINALEVTNGQH